MTGVPFLKLLFSLPGLIAILVILGFILFLSGQNIFVILVAAIFIGLILFIGRKVFGG